MRVEHGVDDIWSVKHILGGIVDIEFVAQYLQLKHAAETPEILAGDTAAAFAVAGEKGLIATDVASELVNATILWRNLQGILRLTVEGGFSDGAAMALKRVITRACGAVDFETLEANNRDDRGESAALLPSVFRYTGKMKPDSDRGAYMPSTDISYTTRDNETFTGYLAEPDGDGKMPGILLITAIFGIDDEMKELANAWAADGFIVSVPDIFWRVMPGPTRT